MHYHIPGIGGLGMSGIAHILLDQGHTVSGCDRQLNTLTAALAGRGVTIWQDQSAAHLAGVDAVITSSALRADAAELLAAQTAGIPVLKRADIWRTWSGEKPTLAVAGTHGKTTTTAICAVVLTHLKTDPAYLVPAGGPVPGLVQWARWGSGPFVIEADEYDRLFLGLLPQVALVTSVDWDHVDIYPTRADAEAAFVQFARQSALVVACGDDAGVQRTLASLAPPIITYGLQAGATWRATDIMNDHGVTRFMVRHADVEPLPAMLHVPGEHNVQNALGAAVGVYELLGRRTPMVDILALLPHYRGAARRFEIMGERDGVMVVDDYAHNPPKVRAALAAARARFPGRRLVVYMQPHTYSRTAALVDEWAHAFSEADLLLLGEIYPSRERQADFPGITSAWLAARIHGVLPQLVGDVDAATDAVLGTLRSGDVFLMLGAGDGNRIGKVVLGDARIDEDEQH